MIFMDSSQELRPQHERGKGKKIKEESTMKHH